ncbi:MAG: ankyrin repeat domain-containing protein, partial [Wolbachia sp.]
RTALHYAVEAKTVKLLVEKGANVNAADVEGYTALHLAVTEKHLETVRELIKSGANVNAEEYENKCTPLHLACMVGCDPKVVILWWLNSIFPKHQG